MGQNRLPNLLAPLCGDALRKSPGFALKTGGLRFPFRGPVPFGTGLLFLRYFRLSFSVTFVAAFSLPSRNTFSVTLVGYFVAAVQLLVLKQMAYSPLP